MFLYELHAYKTDHYDLKAGTTIRLKDFGIRPGKVDKFISDFLAKNPDGKVVVSLIEKRPRWRGQKQRKVFTQTINGKTFA